MSISLVPVEALIPLLIAIEALFSGSEIALLSADPVQLKRLARQGKRAGAWALHLREHPERVLSTTLFMTSICLIGVSVLMELVLSRYEFPTLVSIAFSSGIVILFGELIPKTLFQRHADRIAPFSAVAVKIAYHVFLPFTGLLNLYTTKLTKLVEPIEESIAGRKRTIRDEILMMVTRYKKDTDIRTSEKRIIKRIFDFKDAEARHALIPLVRVNAIEEGLTVREAIEAFVTHRHSRMPVYAERIDNITGVIRATDLLSAISLEGPIAPYVRQAPYVAATQTLEDVLEQMRRSGAKMKVVVDEHGGAIGILTPEDIVEEVVGEIHDEGDRAFVPYKELEAGRHLVQAKAEIHTLNEQLAWELPEGDYETLGGFLLQQFGRIPETGDELFFDTPAGHFKFTIRSANQRRIESVLVERSGF